MKPDQHRSMIELEAIVKSMKSDELRQAIRMLTSELSRRSSGQRKPLKAWDHYSTRG